MSLNVTHPFVSLGIPLLVLLGLVGGRAQGADPVLRFPDDITWKGVFDRGFRPKHVSGLQRNTCEIVDQPFQFQFKSKPELFTLDRGLLSFQLRADDGIRQIWHQSRVPVSMEEGRRRLEQFEKLMAGHMFRKGRMPVLVDEATATVNTDSDFESIAFVDGYSISYGFDSSFVKKAPLIPHFYITSRDFSTAQIVREKAVAPPEGYEWYSLDPKIDTPAPGIRRPMKEPPAPPVTLTRRILWSTGNPLRTLLLLAVVIGGMLVLAILVIVRRVSRGRGK